MFHITMRRRRLLLMILFCEVALYVLTLKPVDMVMNVVNPPVYFPPRPVTLVPERVMPEEGITLLEKFSFETQADLAAWEEKSFHGKTQYSLSSEGEKFFVKAESSQACSGLYHSIQVTATPDLYVDWSWRARKFPLKEAPTRFNDRKQDDFAARIYLVFPGSSFFKSDVIEYLWDENAPKDTEAESPFSDRIKMLVVASGAPAGDGWLTIKRNIFEDYKKLFGRLPEKALGIVAIMSDSDNTGTQAAADFGSIRLYRKTG